MNKRIEFFHRIALLVLYANLKGIRLLPFRFYSTAEEQNKLFKEKKSNCDGYKKRSRHQQWRAIDFVIIDEKGNSIWKHIPEYDALGETWESLDGIWGGRWFKEGKTKFDDVFHFEY